VGVLPYPITFLCTDFISELYGRRRANFVVFVGFLLNLWVVLIIWVGGLWPGFEPEGQERTGLFFDVRTLAFGAVTASMIAYLAAQLVDVQVFHFWKWLTKGKHLWLRNNGSTLISQLVDTTAVILITHFWAGALPIFEDRALWPQLLAFIATGYIFKVLVALVDTVPFYVGAHWLSRYLRLPPPGHWPHPPAAAAVEAGVG
jgi:queuosine precursor transporter